MTDLKNSNVSSKCPSTFLLFTLFISVYTVFYYCICICICICKLTFLTKGNFLNDFKTLTGPVAKYVTLGHSVGNRTRELANLVQYSTNWATEVVAKNMASSLVYTMVIIPVKWSVYSMKYYGVYTQQPANIFKLTFRTKGTFRVSEYVCVYINILCTVSLRWNVWILSDASKYFWVNFFGACALSRYFSYPYFYSHLLDYYNTFFTVEWLLSLYDAIKSVLMT